MTQANKILLEQHGDVTLLDIRGDITILSESFLNDAYAEANNFTKIFNMVGITKFAKLYTTREDALEAIS